MSNQGRTFVLVLFLLAIIWWSSKKKTSTIAPGGYARGAGCGCGSASSGYNGGIYVPRNPTTATGQTLSGGSSGRAYGDFAGSPAPGSNASVPGSGGNWDGVETWRRGPLTPAPVSGYVLPTSSLVATPNTTVTRVQ